MSSAVILAPSSVRSKFSSKILRLYGSGSDPSTASSRNIWYDSSPTWRVAFASKLFTLISPPSIVTNYLDVKITPFFCALLAHRAWGPPPSSSLAEEKRLRSLLLRAPARDSRRSQREHYPVYSWRRAFS